MARVIGYVRVSSPGQRDNTSLPEQERRIREYCEYHGHELIEVYRETKSGASTASRKEFKAALRHLFADGDGLVVWDFWRFSRSLQDSENIRAGLRRKGKLLLSVNQNIDMETKAGKLLFQFTQVMGEDDRINIAERLKGAREAKERQGSWAGHGVPFGLMVVKDKETKLKRLEKDPQTWGTVCSIKASEKSCRDLAAEYGMCFKSVSNIRRRDYDKLLA